jgi:hypothetical protein
MATQVSLCNLALDKVSEKPITTIADVNPRAEACNREYQQALDAVLRRAFWSFAIVRTSLTINSTAPAFGYDSAFDLPADFVRLEAFNNAQAEDYNAQERYKLEAGQILTNETTANITYVKDGTLSPDTVDTLPGLMDPLFIEAFTSYLGAQIAPTVKNADAATNLLNRYAIELGIAKVHNSRERKRRTIGERTESRWVSSRRVSTKG